MCYLKKFELLQYIFIVCVIICIDLFTVIESALSYIRQRHTVWFCDTHKRGQAV